MSTNDHDRSRQPGDRGERAGDAVPNPTTGVGIGAGDPSSFEPEEDDATEVPAAAPAQDNSGSTSDR